MSGKSKTDLEAIKAFTPDVLFQKSQDVVLVSILLESTLSDIIWVRAKKKDDEITISISDEYQNRFSGFKRSFDHIPNQGEVFQILLDMRMKGEDLNFVDFILDRRAGESVEQIMSFLKYESDFYPDLNQLLESHLISLGLPFGSEN